MSLTRFLLNKSNAYGVYLGGAMITGSLVTLANLFNGITLDVEHLILSFPKGAAAAVTWPVIVPYIMIRAGLHKPQYYKIKYDTVINRWVLSP